MQKLRYLLPPPNQLVAFEAAGRLMSFTKASDELNVSRVAVSQQIKALEAYLGSPLFRRHHRALTLTHLGERYHRTVSRALEQIVRSTAEIVRSSNQKTVIITTTTGFATYWLIPNIGSFSQKYHDIELRLVVSDRYLDIVEENIDVAIRYGTPNFNNVDSLPLVQEIIAPTCAAHFIPKDVQLTPQEMAGYRLIDLDGPYDAQTSWQNWFQIQGLDRRTLQRGLTVNTYTNLVQAVLDGQGFALIGPPLMTDFLFSHKLIQPVITEPMVRRSFYLVTPSEKHISESTRLFCDWIKASFS